jgi:hypothetical protein
MGSSRAGNSTRRARRRLLLPDIHAILERFGGAQALIAVALRSLEADDRMKSCLKAIAIAVGLAALDAVYNQLDVADRQLQRAMR